MLLSLWSDTPIHVVKNVWSARKAATQILIWSEQGNVLLWGYPCYITQSHLQNNKIKRYEKTWLRLNGNAGVRMDKVFHHLRAWLERTSNKGNEALQVRCHYTKLFNFPEKIYTPRYCTMASSLLGRVEMELWADIAKQHVTGIWEDGWGPL